MKFKRNDLLNLESQEDSVIPTSKKRNLIAYIQYTQQVNMRKAIGVTGLNRIKKRGKFRYCSFP